MTKITKPITRLLPPPPIPPTPQINQNLQILFRQYLPRPPLIHSLRFPIHNEPQRRGPVGGHEADGCAGRDDGVCGGETLRVADGAEDAAPVGVFAVEGRFDQRVAGDGGGDQFRIGKGGRVDDSHADEFRGAFAVADDELGELLREGCEDALEGDVVWGGGGGDGGAVGGAVGEESDGVVRAGAAVYAYGVEGAGDGGCEEWGEEWGWDGGVGAEEAEEGRHVGVDHAGSFGHAGYGVGC